jgi:hypothetical protein
MAALPNAMEIRKLKAICFIFISQVVDVQSHNQSELLSKLSLKTRGFASAANRRRLRLRCDRRWDAPAVGRDNDRKTVSHENWEREGLACARMAAAAKERSDMRTMRWQIVRVLLWLGKLIVAAAEQVKP